MAAKLVLGNVVHARKNEEEHSYKRYIFSKYSIIKQEMALMAHHDEVQKSKTLSYWLLGRKIETRKQMFFKPMVEATLYQNGSLGADGSV